MSTRSTSPALEAAYDECQAITRREARNFYYAFVTLPHPKRRAIYAAYAFSRSADDIADGDTPIETKRHNLSDLRSRLHDALAGNPAGSVMTALADAASFYAIPESLFRDIIDGVEMDLDTRRYETFDDLKSYCYKVASAVGLVSICIFGYSDPRAQEYAIDLGIAMQLTNIIRDIREDAERDRIYLPQEDLRRCGYTEEELTANVINDAFRNLMAFETDRARGYFESGAKLFPLLQRRSRGCATALHHLYSGLLNRIEKNDFDVFSERISLPAWQKLRLTATLWATSLIPNREKN